MRWSPQQEHAIKEASKWLTDSSRQVFKIFGFAGTGKTTIAKEIAAMAKGNVLFACFTGKAALVLKSKGCAGATTIHSLIYKAIVDEKTGKIDFRVNEDSDLIHAKLLIIDEVSMVGEDVGRDLLSFGVKILVLGDPEQLPPVKGEGFFINGTPDVMLTEIHRQAADNPIIRMSMDVRARITLQPGQYGDSRILLRSQTGKDEIKDIVMSSDQILCGLNRTRQALNSRYRDVLGLSKGSPILPAIGDRLVCLKNNRDKNLLNGGLFEVIETPKLEKPNKIVSTTVRSLDDQSIVDINVPLEFFSGNDAEMDWKKKKRHDEFTYGWALTVHKSQGSQWNNVVVFDESKSFREHASRHLYTAITRAAEKITILI